MSSNPTPGGLLNLPVFDKAKETYDAVVRYGDGFDVEDLARRMIKRLDDVGIPLIFTGWIRLIVWSLVVWYYFWVRMIAFSLGATMLGVSVTKALLQWTANEMIGPTAAFWLDTIEETRKNSTPGINKVMIATLSEMFGVEFTPTDLPTGVDKKGVEERAHIVGAKIYDLLEKEFVPDGVLTPEQGERAAKMFTGFSANFAISSAFIGLVGELMSAGQVEAMREFGVELADTLGLGRMARGGLRDMVGATVATSYEWHINKKYRPTGIAAAQTIEAYFRGLVDIDQVNESLARAGYSDAKITTLIENARPVIGDADLSRFMRHGKMTLEEAKGELFKRGWDDAGATNSLLGNELLRVDARIEEWINTLQTLARNGAIRLVDYNDSIDRLPLFPLEKSFLKDVVGEIFEHPRKQLTISQVEDLVTEDIFSAGDLNQYIDMEGYAGDDGNALQQLILIRVRAEKLKRAEAAAKKLLIPVTVLSVGQLHNAFVDAIITLEEFRAGLLRLHYTEDAITVLEFQALLDRSQEAERRRLAEERHRRNQPTPPTP